MEGINITNVFKVIRRSMNVADELGLTFSRFRTILNS
jgi:hypothetical protein